MFFKLHMPDRETNDQRCFGRITPPCSANINNMKCCRSEKDSSAGFDNAGYSLFSQMKMAASFGTLPAWTMPGS